MLSRLRMTLKDCISWFGQLGDEIFEPPSRPSRKHHLLMGKPKPEYNHERLQHLVRTLVDTKLEPPDIGLFPSDPEQYKT
jgi:hypothetical protein